MLLNAIHNLAIHFNRNAIFKLTEVNNTAFELKNFRQQFISTSTLITILNSGIFSPIRDYFTLKTALEIAIKWKLIETIMVTVLVYLSHYKSDDDELKTANILL